MIGCLRSILAQLSEWLFGMKDECPDLSESARIGVTLMFSTLFVIVTIFAVVLKRRMAIIEAENESLRKEMIRLQMLTLDMIDTVIADPSITLPKISSDNIHRRKSDLNAQSSPSYSENTLCSENSHKSELESLNHSLPEYSHQLIKTPVYESCALNCNINKNSCSNGMILSNHSNGNIKSYKQLCCCSDTIKKNSGRKTLKRQFSEEIENDFAASSRCQCLNKEIQTRVIGHDFTRIRTSDRLRLRTSMSKTL